jgi:hypothetical protein
MQVQGHSYGRSESLAPFRNPVDPPLLRTRTMTCGLQCLLVTPGTWMSSLMGRQGRKWNLPPWERYLEG